MAKFSVFVKTAGGIIATTVTLLTALRDNPQVAHGIDSGIAKLKEATNSENPKIRLDGKLRAIEVAADAVEANFPGAAEPQGWRRQATGLRMRAELAWTSTTGQARRKAIKAIALETTEVLSQVNARLIELQGRLDELTGK